MRDRRGRRLPDFLVVGAAKAGTTALYYWLRRHPQIFLPVEKEPNYLSLRRLEGGWIGKGQNVETEDDYLRLFLPIPGGVVAGDISTTYLYFWEETISSVKALYQIPRQLKIIILLRDPVARMYSHYSMKLRDGMEDLGFMEAVSSETIAKRQRDGLDFTFDYRGFSEYADALEAFRRDFDQVKVMFYEDMSRDPKEFLSEILRFLGVREDLDVNFDSRWNAGGIPKSKWVKPLHKMFFHPNSLKDLLRPVVPSWFRWWLKSKVGNVIHRRPQLSADDRARLSEEFKDQVVRVELLTGRDLSEWKA